MSLRGLQSPVFEALNIFNAPASHVPLWDFLCPYVVSLLHHSLGCVEFGPDVTSSDKSVKVMLNSQDKVRLTWLCRQLQTGNCHHLNFKGRLICQMFHRCSVKSEMSISPTSSVFSVRKPRICRLLMMWVVVWPAQQSLWRRWFEQLTLSIVFSLIMPQKRRGMDIKQMKTFVSEELKGLKQEHRLLSLRECLSSVTDLKCYRLHSRTNSLPDIGASESIMKKKTKQDFQELLKSEHCKNNLLSSSFRLY